VQHLLDVEPDSDISMCFASEVC